MTHWAIENRNSLPDCFISSANWVAASALPAWRAMVRHAGRQAEGGWRSTQSLASVLV